MAMRPQRPLVFSVDWMRSIGTRFDVGKRVVKGQVQADRQIGESLLPI